MNDDNLIQIPRDDAAERLILGCLLFNGDLASELVSHLSADDFFHPTHKQIWRAIRHLESQRQTIDLLTVPRTIQSFNEAADIAYICALVDGIPRYSRASYLSTHVKLVKSAAARRDLLKVSSWMMANATANDNTIDDLLAESISKLQSIELLSETKDELIHSSDAVTRTFQDLEERWARGDKMLGLSTGLSQLDDVTGGLRGGRYYVIAAGTGMGKTTLALNFVNSIMTHRRAENARCAGLVISLEMSVPELTVKMLGINTRIDTWRIETGRLDNDERRKLIIAGDMLSGLDIEYCENFSQVTPASLQSMVERVKTRRGQIDFLVIDYLQLVDSNGKNRNESEHQKISEVSRELKRIAIRYNIPVIALSQLNRKSADRTTRDYQLSDLRGSGSIEQDADCVFFLQPDDWNDETNMKRKFRIAKHRAGKKDVTVELMFFPAHSRFAQFADVSEY